MCTTRARTGWPTSDRIVQYAAGLCTARNCSDCDGDGDGNGDCDVSIDSSGCCDLRLHNSLEHTKLLPQLVEDRHGHDDGDGDGATER